jgi:peroxiredoxin
MSKRNMYLLGGAAVVVGIALIVIALTALSGDDSKEPTTRVATRPTPPEQPEKAPAPAQQQQGRTVEARGKALSEAVSQRRRVRAPGFAVQVLDDGSPPRQAGSLQQAVAGGSLALARLRGTPVVMHVWSPGCGPCRADARVVETTWRRWGRRGVAFVGLAVGGSEQAAREFAREFGLTYPIARDAAGRVADAYGVTSLPETFFISPTGDIIGQVSGSASVRQLELGSAAARTARTLGSEQGGSRVPRR